MKLKDYFITQQYKQLDNTQKLSIYERITNQQAKASFSRARRFVYIRSFAYSFAAFLLIVGLYGSDFLQQQIALRFDGFSLQKPLNRQVVQAQHVGKVVDFNGQFYIETPEGRVQTSTINAGDVVTLHKNAEMTFHIDDGTQAIIYGPAEFMIEQIDKTADLYTLHILKGDFVEIQSLSPDSKQKVDVAIDDIVVKQDVQATATHYQVFKQNGEHIVSNRGEKLVVTRRDETNAMSVEQAVEQEQSLAIAENDITLIAGTQEFGKALEDKNITQTMAILPADELQAVKDTSIGTGSSTGDADTGTVHADADSIFSATLATLDVNQGASTDSGTVSSGVVSSLSAVIDSKEILSPTQNDTLHDLLRAGRLEHDMHDILEALQIQDMSLYTKSLADVQADTIAPLYAQFNIGYDLSAQPTPGQLIDDVQHIQMHAEEYYHMPPRYVYNLTVLSKRLRHIQSLEGQTDIVVETPADLQFN